MRDRLSFMNGSRKKKLLLVFKCRSDPTADFGKDCVDDGAFPRKILSRYSMAITHRLPQDKADSSSVAVFQDNFPVQPFSFVKRDKDGAPLVRKKKTLRNRPTFLINEKNGLRFSYRS